ncbi:MAG TPA: Uma2 family endonuclease [Gemmatimonadaceae bacterium]|nr:Uma2 family endonuclease [Gemmatimonadaceae bacterium]
MPATHTDWTVEMLDALPEDGRRYELIDGALLVTPAPGESHQLIVGDLYAVLREYLRRWPGIGRATLSPSDVRRGDRRKNRVQPDVFVLRVTDGHRPEYPYALDRLLLAVEVVSPRSQRYDYQVKRDLYLRGGVSEYWVVNPESRNVSRWRGLDDPGELLSLRLDWRPSPVIEPLVIDLPRFFEESLD